MAARMAALSVLPDSPNAPGGIGSWKDVVSQGRQPTARASRKVFLETPAGANERVGTGTPATMIASTVHMHQLQGLGDKHHVEKWTTVVATLNPRAGVDTIETWLSEKAKAQFLVLERTNAVVWKGVRSWTIGQLLDTLDSYIVNPRPDAWATSMPEMWNGAKLTFTLKDFSEMTLLSAMWPLYEKAEKYSEILRQEEANPASWKALVKIILTIFETSEYTMRGKRQAPADTAETRLVCVTRLKSLIEEKKLLTVTDLLDAFYMEVLIEFTKYKEAGPSVMEIARANKTVDGTNKPFIPQQGQGGSRTNPSDRKRPRDDGEKIPYKDRVPCANCGRKHLGICNDVKDAGARANTPPSLGMKLNDHKVSTTKSPYGGHYGPGDRQTQHAPQASKSRHPTPNRASLKAIFAVPGVADALEARGAMDGMEPKDKEALSRALKRVRQKANKKKGAPRDT
jgi:hypothetical protein